MGVNIKFVFRKANKEASEGYVALRRIKDRKATYRSLGLPRFHEKYWDSENQRLKKTTKLKYKDYNDTIEKTLAEVISDGKTLEKFDGVNSKVSYLKHFEEIVNGSRLRLKHGTRIKYNTVYRKLEAYLKSENKSDLLFSELTPSFLDDFHYFMRTTELEVNTAIHYLKILKVIYRKRETGFSTYDPFAKYQFERKEKKLKESLTHEEISSIIKADIDNHRLNRIRHLFLFQFFVGGMRVSDLVTLRFNNLIDGRVGYKMYKTRQPIDVPITEVLFGLIEWLVGLNLDINELVASEIDVSELRDKKIELAKEHKFKVSESEYFQKDDFDCVPISVAISKKIWLEANQLCNSLSLEELQIEFDVLKQFIDQEGMAGYGLIGYDFKQDYLERHVFYEQLLDKIGQKMVGLKQSHLNRGIAELSKLASDPDTANQFVFGMLKNEDFDNIDGKNDFTILNIEQYNKVNKAGIVYNRNLKELQRKLGISKKLGTHMPRTSFANIMMNSGASTMDISKTLGHSSLSITDEYLKTGFNNGRTDEIMKGLGDQFN